MEGVIIEWPLNGQFHDILIIIITSQIVISNNFLTVAAVYYINVTSFSNISLIYHQNKDTF